MIYKHECLIGSLRDDILIEDIIEALFKCHVGISNKLIYLIQMCCTYIISCEFIIVKAQEYESKASKYLPFSFTQVLIINESIKGNKYKSIKYF